MATAPKPAGFAYSLIANAIIDELSDTYLYVRASKDAPTTKAIPVPRDRALLAQCISGGTVDDLVRNTVITVKFDPTGVVRPEILIQSKPQKEQLAGATVSARAGSKLFVTTASGESRVFQIEGGEAAWKEAVVGGDAAQLVFGAKVDIDYDPSGREGIQIRVVSPPAPAKAKGCSASAGPQGWSGLAGLGLVLGAVWRTRRRRHGVLLAALPLLVVAAAGCSDTTTGDGNNLADATNDVGGSPFDTKLQDGQDAMADIPQQTSCEFPFEPAKGQPGAACSENKDCDNGLCVDGPSGKICTTICTTCCPTGFFCGQNQIASGDFAYVCLPRLGALCRPCTTTTECEDANPGSRCLDYGASGKFCGATCSSTDDCPAGYSCVPDGDAKQCKLDTGECSCNQKAIDAAASTSCSVTSSYGSCPGTRQCTAAGLQACSGATPAPESCNGKDDDCDGQTDEGTTGLDTDKDGTDDCVDADDDGDGTPDDQDCAPLDKTIGPNADETCDNKDNDCDGQTDEEGAAGCSKWYQDADKDSFGSPIAQCLCAPTGDLTAKSANDCDDGNADANPSKPEVCGNSLDDDCDGSTDEWDGTVNCQNFYADGDNDGWGSGAPACRCGPSQAHPASKSGDCDDAASNISPSTAESCNGKDDNCDGVTDEEEAVGCTQWYVDGDKDGYGNAALSACLCKPNSAFPAAAGGDCNDNAKSVSPGANEACGGGDEDCDGATDETGADGCTNWYPDADSDGYGGASGQCRCSSGGGYTATTNTDCNDASNSAYPGATELCNGVDDDCDNMADDGFGLGLGCGAGQGSCIATGKIVCAADGKSSYCSANATAGSPESCNNADDDCDGQTDEGCDDDGDGWCDSALGYQASSACPKGPGDCNDASGQQNPGTAELCNGKDDDCNGQTDGQTQACSNGYTSGTETCVAGSWQNCSAPRARVHQRPVLRQRQVPPGYLPVRHHGVFDHAGLQRQLRRRHYPDGAVAVLHRQQRRLRHRQLEDRAKGRGQRMRRGQPVQRQRRHGVLPGLRQRLRGRTLCQAQPKVTVCIDPGYGGTETGAVTSEGIQEQGHQPVDGAVLEGVARQGLGGPDRRRQLEGGDDPQQRRDGHGRPASGHLQQRERGARAGRQRQRQHIHLGQWRGGVHC
jgi:hypothetical protein